MTRSLATLLNLLAGDEQCTLGACTLHAVYVEAKADMCCSFRLWRFADGAALPLRLLLPTADRYTTSSILQVACLSMACAAEATVDLCSASQRVIPMLCVVYMSVVAHVWYIVLHPSLVCAAVPALLQLVHSSCKLDEDVCKKG